VDEDDMLPQPSWTPDDAAKVAELLPLLEDRHDFHVAKLAWATEVVIATRRRSC
jgi:hypothetical protein